MAVDRPHRRCLSKLLPMILTVYCSFPVEFLLSFSEFDSVLANNVVGHRTTVCSRLLLIIRGSLMMLKSTLLISWLCYLYKNARVTCSVHVEQTPNSLMLPLIRVFVVVNHRCKLWFGWKRQSRECGFLVYPVDCFLFFRNYAAEIARWVQKFRTIC